MWLVWFFSTGSTSLGIGWIRVPVLADIPLTLWNLASGFGGIGDAPSTLLGLILVIVVGIGLAGAGRSLGIRLILAGILLPIAGVWLISQRRPVYVDRYFVVVLPFLVGLVALGTGALSRRWAARRAIWGAAAVGAVLVALSAGLTVHSSQKFSKEDWRGLAAFLLTQEGEAGSLSFSEPEITLPLSYYFGQALPLPVAGLIPDCGDACWWVLRQPYTATHAFTQSVAESGRASSPPLPDGCERTEGWDSPTGVEAWGLSCAAGTP
jgi:hypothetical protein